MAQTVAQFRVARLEESRTYNSETKQSLIEEQFVDVRFETTAINQTQTYFSLKLPRELAPSLFFGRLVHLVIVDD